jgi:uncharacterized phage-associated protein
VPGWSTEIANEFIRVAAAEGKAFSQMHLQELVYIAHGWCLALTGQPLTGDRPEAFEFGPEYRRLADALVMYGTRPVTKLIGPPRGSSRLDTIPIDDPLGADERAIVDQVYAKYAHLKTSDLASITRAENAPWRTIFKAGEGAGRDIPHQMIRRQFAEIAARPS